jgi:hypothetical protein
VACSRREGRDRCRILDRRRTDRRSRLADHRGDRLWMAPTDRPRSSISNTPPRSSSPPRPSRPSRPSPALASPPPS